MSVKWLNKQTINHTKNPENKMVKYKDCKKTKTTWKDLQKAWSTTAEAYLKNTRKSNPLDEKYKEMIGRLQPLHSIVMLIKGKFYIF